jgi:hypothetical protein
MRFAKESRMPLPTETVYCPDLVVTGILRTLRPSYRKAQLCVIQGAVSG